MASTTLLLKGSTDPCSIYIRFTEGRLIDLKVNTGLCVNRSHWDAKNKRIRNMIEIPNRDEVNSKLAKLQIGVLDQYNIDYSNGVLITSKWLKTFIKLFFNRPAEEIVKGLPNHEIYFSSFCEYWMKNKASKFRNKKGETMSDKTIDQYQHVLESFISYEGKNKIRLEDLDSDKLNGFSDYLSITLNHTEATAKRKLTRLKFFCFRAEADNVHINKNFKNSVSVKKDTIQYKEPYLNHEEIESIFKLDLSHDAMLDNARDNFIIGLWTGLRVSDFLTRLKPENIGEKFIEIKTKKTGYNVAIPIHPMVRKVLDKRGGYLPLKISEQRFNDKIKIIAQLAEIDHEIIGGTTKVEKKGDIKRKKVGTYKKYLLVSSHICRRSFCTNNYGKISNKSLMDIQGWKKESQMFDYLKQTNLESAKELEKAWEKTYN